MNWVYRRMKQYGDNWRFTGNVVTEAEKPFEAATIESVKEKLGHHWRLKLPKLLKLLEWLEWLYPTDMDKGEYKEFYLCTFEQELVDNLGGLPFYVAKYRRYATKIGLLKLTNDFARKGVASKCYIYNPIVGEILEELNTLKYREEPKPRPRPQNNHKWVKNRKKYLGENWIFSGKTYPYNSFNETDEEDLKQKLNHSYKKLIDKLICLATFLDYHNPTDLEKGECKEIYISFHDAALMDNFKSGYRLKPLLKKAVEFGMLKPTENTDPESPLCPTYIYNPKILEKILELN